MLETRTPSVSPAKLGARPLPRPAAARPLPAARPAPARSGRMARSESRLLTFAVAGTALMCAVLLVYLAAYAHISQLGLEQSRARAQLRMARQENDVLQAQLAGLQNPAHIVASALKMGMTAGTGHATYLFVRGAAARTADGGNGDGQGFQGTNGGTSADGNTAATLDH